MPDEFVSYLHTNYPKKIREFVPKKLAAKKNRRFDHIVGMDFNPSYFENI